VGGVPNARFAASLGVKDLQVLLIRVIRDEKHRSWLGIRCLSYLRGEIQ
jgi:hypothetical protein